MGDSTGGKGQKPQGKPHTGMIEFKYSKIVEDYQKMKSTKFDLDTYKRMHPKKEGIDVILHKFEDRYGRSADLKVFSYILRSGNFGTPAPINLTSLSLNQDSQSVYSLPNLPRETTKGNTISTASAALSKMTTEQLPPLKTSKRNTFITEQSRRTRGGNLP